MAIEEAKDLATMTMEELLGYFITHEQTLQIDEEEMETTKKNHRILMQEEDDDLDEEMAPLTRKFKKFFKRKIGANASRK